MLIHPWDAARDDDEWRSWLAEGRNFGQLIATGEDWPVVVPAHFVLAGDSILVHLARPNPIWPVIERTGRVVLSVLDDYAFVPSTWRVPSGAEPLAATPTSYYTAVQLRCRAEVVDAPEAKAALLRTQLAALQPEGGYAEPDAAGAHSRLLPGIRGMRLDVVEALVKYKYDDNKPALQAGVNVRLGERGQGHDAGAAAQQRRRMSPAGRAAPTGGQGG